MSVTFAQGFSAAGVAAGISAVEGKKDLALVVNNGPLDAAAGVFTSNRFCAAPVQWSRNIVSDGHVKAVILNSGGANACTGKPGYEQSKATAEKVASLIGAKAEDVAVCSTGLIGELLPLDNVLSGADKAFETLADTAEAGADASHAIMTTDTVKKEAAVETTVGGKTVRMGGIAKGSGMIHPNMATMLAFITTDADISAEMLKKSLLEVVKDSFNMLSVDGDTSTNDTVAVLASGLCGNEKITSENADYKAFTCALAAICEKLVKLMAKDGEGATKLVECIVSGADDQKTAKICAKSVICSSLVKAAMFGADANWGRILCALGYSGADIDVHKVDVKFSSAGGEIEVCKDGSGIPFSEELAKKVLVCDEVYILVDLKSGSFSAAAYGCDLTYDYVKINGDYRT